MLRSFQERPRCENVQTPLENLQFLTPKYDASPRIGKQGSTTLGAGKEGFGRFLKLHDCSFWNLICDGPWHLKVRPDFALVLEVVDP